MNKIKMTCRFCSAPLDITEGSKFAVCEYCGKNQPIVDNPFPEPVAKPEEKIAAPKNNTKLIRWILGACIGAATGLIFAANFEGSFLVVALLIIVAIIIDRFAFRESNENSDNNGH